MKKKLFIISLILAVIGSLRGQVMIQQDDTLHNLAPDNFSNLTPINDPSEYPWRMNCKIQGPGGTGVLIDSRHILTAGHCIYNFDNSFYYQNTRIIPGYSNGDMPFGDAGELDSYVWPQWVNNGDPDYDLGIIYLDRPVGAITGWYEYYFNTNDDFFTESSFNNPGYPGNPPYTGELLYNWSGSFDLTWDDQVFIFFNEAIGGQSGSGAYTGNSDNYTVYAILTRANFLGLWTGYTRITQSKFEWIQSYINNHTPAEPDLIPIKNTTFDTYILEPGLSYNEPFLIHNYSFQEWAGDIPFTTYLSVDDIITDSDMSIGTQTINVNIGPKETLQITPDPVYIPCDIYGSYYIGILLNTIDTYTSNNSTNGDDAQNVSILNFNPSLYDQSVLPNTGTTNTNFEFKIFFRDDQSPQYVKVIGTDWEDNMIGSGANYCRGIPYTISKTFPTPGIYSYYFEARTESNQIIRYPASGYLNLLVNDGFTSQLYSGQVSPTQGNTSTNFQFSVNFKDSQAPQYVKTIGTGWTLNMTGSGNYTSGVQFTTNNTFSSPGNYTYFFEAKTATNEILRYPASGFLSLNVSQNAAGWDLQVTNLNSNPTYLENGGNVTVTATVHNNSNTPDKVYTNVPYTFEMYSPAGALIDSENGVIASLSQTSSINITKTLTTGTANGIYNIIFTISPYLDSSPENNSMTRAVIVGQSGPSEQYFVPVGEGFVEMSSTYPTHVFNGHTYTITTILSSYVRIKEGNNSALRIDLRETRGYVSGQHLLVDEYNDEGGNSAGISFGYEYPNYTTFTYTNITCFPGDEISFFGQCSIQAFQNTDPDIYNNSEVEDWYDYMNLTNNNHNAEWIFDVPSNASTGTYNFTIGARFPSNSRFIRDLQITVVPRPPVISGLSSYTLSADDQISITGSYFGSSQGTVKFFNNLNAVVLSWSNTLITCRVPNGVQSGNVFVINNGGSSNGKSYTVISSTGDPVVVQPIPDQEMIPGETLTVASLGMVFSDPNNDPLVYSVTSTSPDLIASINSGILSIEATTTASGQAQILVSATDLDNATVQDEFIVNVIVPELIVVPESLNFGDVLIGMCSTPQIFTISGSNLISDILISAPSGFEVSFVSGGDYVNSLILSKGDGTVNNSTIYSRFCPELPAPYIGSISNITAGATVHNVAVNGTGLALCPVSVIITPSANPVCSGTSVTFTATPANGGTSPAYQWKRNGTNVGTNSPTYILSPANNDLITCVLTSNLSCATGNPATSNPITMTVNPVPSQPGAITGNASPAQGTTEIYSIQQVSGASAYTWTLPPGWSGSSSTNSITATVGATGGTISVTASNACGTSPASTLNVNVTGTPTIIVSPQTLAFGNVILGSDSPAQSYNVQGSNLTTDILVTAPAGFSVSLSETGPWTGSLPLSMTEGIVNAIVFVRFSPTVATAYSGNITNASAGATTQNVAVSGTGTVAGEPIITVDPPLLSQTLTFTGNCPPAQTYTVSASNLIEDLTIYVHPEYGNAEISQTGEEGDYHLALTLVTENGAIPPTVIYVRNCPFDYALTDYYSAILNSSSGITQFVDVYTYPVSGNAPITTIANVTAEPGELVNVPVTVSDFNYLGQVQYIIEFDPTVLTFQDLANIYAPYNNWTTVQPVNSNLAQLYINLEYQSDLWMTIPDNEKLFDLVFLYAGGSSSLNFGDCSFYDSWNHLLNDEPASTYYVSGSVSQAIPPPVITNSVNGIINEYYSQMNTPATSYQVVASNLTGDLTIQAFSSSPTPENCQIEVSLFPDQGFDTQLILSPNNGVINTTIFVKPACTDVPVFCMGSIIQSSEGAVSDIIYVTIENEYWIQYAPVVTIHEVMATPGTTVYVPMTGVNFNSVGVAEYYIDYDPEVLSYSGLENIHPSLPYYFICNNCPDPNNCCNGMIDYMLSYVSIINPDINRLYIKVKWEVNHFNVPDGEKVFDIVFNYSAGYSDLIFTGGSYAYSGNMGPYDPEIINEPFEDYYFNGSVSQANPPTIYVSVDTLVFQDVFYNTTSPPLRYMVSGINLTADLEIDAVSDASDFPCLEISRFNESGYANSLSIPQVNGTVENTEIYVKWSAGGACYIYPYSAVLNSSTGAPSKPVLILEGSSGPQVQDAPTIIIGDVGADPGSLVIVPVTVRNFSFLRNLTLVIDYNPQVITFQNCLCNIDPYYTLNTIQVSPELYRLQISIQSWNFDQTLNLPDFSKLLDLEFLYISGSTSLTLSPESYFTGQNNQVLNDEPYSAHYFNGSVGPFTKNINLTICLEGLYNEATGFMNKAQHESGNMFPGTIADRITVKLAKSTFPYNFISVYENLELNQDKTCTLQLPANMDDEYYLVINHRNSIETWSANPVAFGSDNVYYSFTQDPQFSYNSNVKLLGNSWCIYGGDVNQDDVIDTGDMTPVDNDASSFATGYLSTDVNGDGVIDTGDMTIVDNNTSGFISASYPLVPPTAVVETTQITPLSGNSVICSGNVTYQGSTMVTQRGVCWSTSTEPDYYDNHASNGIGLGAYNCQINGLTPDTQYYFRAYAYNGTGFSYGNELSCITPVFTLGEGVNDFDGNTYTSVIIGTQEWMAENLKVTHYNNGDIIPIITDNTWINLTTGAMCWYENDEATYTNPYGALYNFYAVADPRNLCPAGWHVPSDTEWAELIEFLGGANNADEKLKEAGFEHWNPLGFDADNSSGFTGLPGGRRTSNGAFSSIVDQGFWWSTNEATSATAWGRSLGYNFIGIVRNDYNKKNGNSVRCLKTVN